MQASSMEHAGRIPLAFWKFHLKSSPAPVTCPCHTTSSLLWHSLTQMLPLSTYPNTQVLLTKPRCFKPNHNPTPYNNSRAVIHLSSLFYRAHRASQSTVTDATSKCHKLLPVLLSFSIRNRTDISLLVKCKLLRTDTTPKRQQETIPCKTEPAHKEYNPARKPVSRVAYIQTAHPTLNRGALRRGWCSPF